MTATLTTTLTGRDRLCFHCTLPECDPDSPRCLWKHDEPSDGQCLDRARKKRDCTRWGWLVDRVGRLQQRGGIETVIFNRRDELRRAQCNILGHARRGKLPPLVTWSRPVHEDDGPRTLFIRLVP